jgi:hypothetical protein
MTEQDGKTAIKYFQCVPHKVRIENEMYYFTVKANICLCWINNEHVPIILTKTKRCCGNNSKTVYRYANELDITRWSGLGER